MCVLYTAVGRSVAYFILNETFLSDGRTDGGAGGREALQCSSHLLPEMGRM